MTEEAVSSDSAKTARYLSHLKPLQAVLEAYCRRHLHDPNGVEDVLQEMLTKTFRDFHLYREGTNFRAWVFRYLNLEILAWNRKHRRIPETAVVELAAEPSDELFETDLETVHELPDNILQRCDETLAAAIRDLSEAERSVLLLRAIGEFAYREISDILSLPVGTVMSHLSRARGKLRRRLQADAVDPACERSARGSWPAPREETGE